MVRSKRWATGAPPACPQCGSKRVTPIMYGLPSIEGREAAQRGEIVLGGCVIFDDAPEWLCGACHNRFGSIFAGDSEDPSRA
jgi:hypothetical protein